MKRLVVALAAALLAVSGMLLWQLRRESSPAQATRATSVPDMRARIRQAVQSDLPALKTEADVDRYLAELMARAKRNHRVTALEVQPGLEAIRQLRSQLGDERSQTKLMAFSDSMEKLSAEFDTP